MPLPDLDTPLRLFKIFETGATSDPLDEILELVGMVNPNVDEELIITFHRDIQDIFSGYYPGFRENGNKYHNLRHTYGVVLATARLFHGLMVEGQKFSSKSILQGILCAYFHDTGLLLRSFDTADTGAEFTKYHEARSISSLFKYLEPLNFDDSMRMDCGSIIRCTNLELKIDTIEFSSPEAKTAGQILATADILAQMADRYYLEQLPHLFQEHRAGGLHAYDTAFDLMKDTNNFYHNFIVTRLNSELANTARAMKIHFTNRWNIDRDLYIENIENNINYLHNIIAKCGDDFDELYLNLRRRPPFRF
ncbi:MAG: hypothetical protein D6B25_03910 [Desulfobulbaceae bacterium]|nr:MAG: hypothetical protein D6B25_03910 [Desulfobulbaceae bacterium]